MLKRDLVSQLWLRFPDFRRKDLESILDLFFDYLARSLREGHRIEIRGFGRFLVKEQKGRLFKNPRTNEVSRLPARRRVIFKPGKDLKDRVNQGALAGLDLGTQTFRLLVAKPEGDGWRTILRERLNVRLGEGLAERGEIGREAFERGLLALRRLRELMERAGVERYLACGTAVFREASNAREFLEAAREEGIEIEVLPPEEEALLTARGVLVGLEVPREPVLVADVGGGSTELVLCEPGGEAAWRVSLPLGAVVLTRRFLRHEVPRDHELAALDREVREALAGVRPPSAPARLVATGGTASCLAAIHLGLERYNPQLIHGTAVSRRDLEQVFRRLGLLSPSERLGVKGMEPGREDIILAGLRIYLLLLEHFSLPEITVSESGILEGLLLRLGQRSGLF